MLHRPGPTPSASVIFTIVIIMSILFFTVILMLLFVYLASFSYKGTELLLLESENGEDVRRARQACEREGAFLLPADELSHGLIEVLNDSARFPSPVSAWLDGRTFANRGNIPEDGGKLAYCRHRRLINIAYNRI